MLRRINRCRSTATVLLLYTVYLSRRGVFEIASEPHRLIRDPDRDMELLSAVPVDSLNGWFSIVVANPNAIHSLSGELSGLILLLFA